MATAKPGDPKIDAKAWNAGVEIHEATNGNVLKNLDLHTLEYVREKCAFFLARSEKYIRIRQDQGLKSQIRKINNRSR